jgi:hypothetical protein
VLMMTASRLVQCSRELCSLSRASRSPNAGVAGVNIHHLAVLRANCVSRGQLMACGEKLRAQERC